MPNDQLTSDLSPAAVTAFLREQDPELSLEKAVGGMEAVETWTRDRADKVQAALQALADRMDLIDMSDISQDTHNRLIVLLSYISTGKALKLMCWIDASSPNFVARTLAEAQMLAVMDKMNEGAARLFIERIEVVDRLQMLSRIFSEDRIVTIQKVLRILTNEDTGDEDDDGDEGFDEPAEAGAGA